MTTLIDQIQTAERAADHTYAAKRAAAQRDYYAILARRNNPDPGDGDRLREVLEYIFPLDNPEIPEFYVVKPEERPRDRMFFFDRDCRLLDRVERLEKAVARHVEQLADVRRQEAERKEWFKASIPELRRMDDFDRNRKVNAHNRLLDDLAEQAKEIEGFIRSTQNIIESLKHGTPRLWLKH